MSGISNNIDTSFRKRAWLVAAFAFVLFLAGCNLTSRPQSMENVAGSYALTTDTLSKSGMEAELPDNLAGISVLEFQLDEDGTGSITTPDGTEYEFSWRLVGTAHHPEVVMKLDQALVTSLAKRKELGAVLLAMTEEPNHNQIRGAFRAAGTDEDEPGDSIMVMGKNPDTSEEIDLRLTHMAAA